MLLRAARHTAGALVAIATLVSCTSTRAVDNAHTAVTPSAVSVDATKPPWEAIPSPDYTNEQLSIQADRSVVQSGQLESSLPETPPLWTLSAYEAARTDVNETSLIPVSGGNLYLFDSSDRIRAIDLHSGRPSWHGVIPLLSPLQARGEIIIGVHRDGTIYAFAARDGKMLWHRPAGLKLSWMSLIDDTLVAYDKDEGFEGLDAATGAGRWTFRRAGTNPESAPMRRGDVLFIPGSESSERPNTTTYALDFRRGKLLWTAHFVGLPAGFADGNAYMLDNAVIGDIRQHRAIHLDMIGLRDGELHGTLELNPDPWPNANIPQTMYTQIRVTNESIYVSMGDNFYQYSRAEAPEKQRPLQVSTVGNNFVAGPLDDWFYFSDPVGMVLIRFGDHKVEKLEVSLDGAQVGPLLVVGNSAFFGTTEGRIYALDLRTHRLKMRTSKVCSTPSALTMNGDVLIAYCSGPEHTLGWPKLLAFRTP